MTRFWVASALTTLWSPVARAQEDAPTWTNNRTDPGQGELIAVDATGEARWPYGRESVLDNGNAFTPAEASIDLRTAYADTTGTELWVRAYTVGAPPATSLKVVFFLDADHGASTGGSAVAPVIDEHFDSDPTDGGYEYALLVPADPAVSAELYQWGTSSDWTLVASQPALVKSSGTATDTLRDAGDQHGYVQVRTPLESVGLTRACDARIFVRGADEESHLEPGDLALGQPGDCVPVDANDNGVPDIEESGQNSGGAGPDGAGLGNADAGAGPDVITIADDEEVRGGAFTCALGHRTAHLYTALGVVGLGLACRRRRARRHQEPSSPLL
ncbi:MAG: hypothetical protein JW940_03020 [Polyangiaceae bacterium]|nr:hypothetical protein [Polyangiaceae bacterium]